MTNAHSPAHSTTGPLVHPAGGHYPAGYVSPQAAEAAERAAIALELSQEQEEAGRAATEQAINERIASRRGHVAEPEAVTAE